MIDNLHHQNPLKKLPSKQILKFEIDTKKKKVMIVENMDNAFKVIGSKHIVNYLMLLVIIY